MTLLASKLLDGPGWYYRKRYNLAPTDPRFLDATDLDVTLDLYMHAEHDRRIKRLERGEDDTVESMPDAGEAFDRALAAEAALADEGEEMSTEDFEASLLAGVRAIIEANQREDGDTEERRALRALKGFLGDRYREADFLDRPE